MPVRCWVRRCLSPATVTCRHWFSPDTFVSAWCNLKSSWVTKPRRIAEALFLGEWARRLLLINSHICGCVTIGAFAFIYVIWTVWRKLRGADFSVQTCFEVALRSYCHQHKCGWKSDLLSNPVNQSRVVGHRRAPGSLSLCLAACHPFYRDVSIPQSRPPEVCGKCVSFLLDCGGEGSEKTCNCVKNSYLKCGAGKCAWHAAAFKLLKAVWHYRCAWISPKMALQRNDLPDWWERNVLRSSQCFHRRFWKCLLLQKNLKNNNNFFKKFSKVRSSHSRLFY